MIDAFVKAFDAERDALYAHFKSKHPEAYIDIVREVLEAICRGFTNYDDPEPSTLQQFGGKDYSGTMFFVVSSNSEMSWWYLKIDYGSCSVCDTLEGIRSDINVPPTDDEAKEYMKLALHIVQRLKFAE